MWIFLSVLFTHFRHPEYNPGHLPDLLDLESMIDVLTLCNFCILANVLDFRTYSFNALKESDSPSPVIGINEFNGIGMLFPGWIGSTTCTFEDLH